MSEITLFTKDVCPRCHAVKKRLDAHDIEYSVINLDENPDKVERFKSLGIMSAPVVQAGEHYFTSMSEILGFIKNFTRE